jgi:hypothetical protein
MRELKPYQLVLVKRTDEWTHVGQIISRPTPEGTVMVRMVPDDPATMMEWPITNIAQTDLKWRWVSYAEVHGKSYFPVDMLRYDFCTPVNFRLEKRKGTLSILEPVLNDGENKLIVATCSMYKGGGDWHGARWASFGWTLNRLQTIKIVGS